MAGLCRVSITNFSTAYLGSISHFVHKNVYSLEFEGLQER